MRTKISFILGAKKKKKATKMFSFIVIFAGEESAVFNTISGCKFKYSVNG